MYVEPKNRHRNLFLTYAGYSAYSLFFGSGRSNARFQACCERSIRAIFRFGDFWRLPVLLTSGEKHTKLWRQLNIECVFKKVSIPRYPLQCTYRPKGVRNDQFTILRKYVEFCFSQTVKFCFLNVAQTPGRAHTWCDLIPSIPMNTRVPKTVLCRCVFLFHKVSSYQLFYNPPISSWHNLKIKQKNNIIF